MSDIYQDFLSDFVRYVKERALEARDERDRSVGEGEAHDFNSGRLMAFNEVVAIAIQHADGMGIELAELGLDDIEPDEDLV